MLGVYDHIYCPGCGIDLGSFDVNTPSRVHCTGCDITMYLGISGRKDADVTIQFPILPDEGDLDRP